MTTHRTSDYNLWIVVNGNEQRITNNTVRIPFGTEYSIRVRNNTDVRAKFKISIDGLENHEEFVLGPHETSTIDRFLNGNLGTGARFKFVQKDSADVQNPDSPRNGEIQVSFYREWTFEPIIIKRYDWPSYCRPTYWDPFWTSTCDPIIGSSTSTYSSFCCNSTPIALNNCDVGATVEGSQSNQKFIQVDDFQTWVIPTVLTLNLRGLSLEEVVAQKVVTAPKSTGLKYCGNCGTSYYADKKAKFCTNCGHKH